MSPKMIRRHAIDQSEALDVFAGAAAAGVDELAALDAPDEDAPDDDAAADEELLDSDEPDDPDELSLDELPFDDELDALDELLEPPRLSVL